MNKYSAILIDDEPIALSDLSCMLEESCLFYVEHTFPSVEACYQYLRESRGKKLDFIFCDVELDGMTGVHAVELLRTFTDFFVLCTGHPEYALEGHQRLADGFLLKPVTMTYLMPLVDKLTSRRTNRERDPVVDYIWARKPRPQAEMPPPDQTKQGNIPTIDTHKGEHRDFVRIELQDIVFFRRNGNDVDILVLDKYGKLFVAGKSRTTIKNVYRKYKHTNLFLYANVSQLIHVAYIDYVDPRMIRVKGNEWISISDTFRPYFNAYMKGSDLSK